MTGSGDPERPWGSPPTEPPWDTGAAPPEPPPARPVPPAAARPPITREVLPPAAKPARSNKSTGCGCLLLAVVVIAAVAFFMNQGGGGSTGAVASKWTLDAAKSTMATAGFAGSSSPLADGTPRWLMSGPDSSGFEAIGKEGALSEVTLSLAVADDGSDSNSSTALVTFLTAWAPDASSFIKGSLTEALVSNVDARQTFSGYSVHVQSIGAGDGILLIVSVDRT